MARELERRWEQALIEKRQLEEEFRRFESDQPKELSQSDLKQIETLSANLPLLWHSKSTSNADRQSIVRHLINQVVVDVQGETELVDVTIHWVGGFVSQKEVLRAIGSYEQLHRFGELKSLVEELWKTGHPTQAISDRLNADGFRTPKLHHQFTRHMVRKLLDKWGLTILLRPIICAGRARLEPHEWWTVDLAREIGMDLSTLNRWCRKGWVHKRELKGRCKWIVWADDGECERLKKLYANSRGKGKNKYTNTDLKVPKPISDQ